MHLKELNKLAAVGGNRTASSRMPSAGIWRNCPYFELQNGLKDGHAVFNDFTTGHYTQAANVAASATTIRDGGMAAFTGATAGGTVGPSLAAPYGVVELKNTTDGEATVLQLAGNGNIAGQFVFEAGKKTWMEARIKVANITTNEHGVALVFGEEGLTTATGVITAADALADKDLVGFHYTAAATTAIGTYHNTAGGGGISTIDATAGVLAADTFTKLGLYSDGTTVKFFQDGVLLDTTVLVAATNFPDGEEMALYFALVTGSGGGDCTASIDWFRAAQERA
jgi:hypothetical protein